MNYRRRNMLIQECFEYNQHFVAMMNIINLARRTNLSGKFQRHHIIPKCFYKVKGLEIDNSESNLVNLTYEQHRQVHQLAVLCAKEIVLAQLRAASYFMETYVAKTRLGGHLSDEHRAKISAANKIAQNRPEVKAKISSMNKGKKFSEEHKTKISASLKGHKVSDEYKANMSAAMKGKKRGPYKRRSY